MSALAKTATRVQIVDDHFLFAEALGSVIRELPEYDVVGIAVTGPQAISMAQEKQPQVILLDYHLPGYTAEQIIPRLRSLSPNSRVIILTSDTSTMTLAKSLQAGVSGYLTKDRALDDVVAALKQVAAGQNIITEAQAAALPETASEGDALTTREVEILNLLAMGKDAVAIADELTISANTVRTHLQNIFSKLGAHSRLEAVVLARSRGAIR